MKLKQNFENLTNTPIIINLELSTSRFKLNPGERLLLFYDAEAVTDGRDAPLKTSFTEVNGKLELVIWTEEDQMFLPDGSAAPLFYNLTENE